MHGGNPQARKWATIKILKSCVVQQFQTLPISYPTLVTPSIHKYHDLLSDFSESSIYLAYI
jgi:hypothetical protein